MLEVEQRTAVIVLISGHTPVLRRNYSRRKSLMGRIPVELVRFFASGPGKPGKMGETRVAGVIGAYSEGKAPGPAEFFKSRE